MTSGMGTVLTVAVFAALPAAWLSYVFVRRETDHIGRPVLAWIVAADLLVAVWAPTVTPPDYVLIASLLLGWALVALSAVDYLAFRLPDILTLPLIGCGLLLAFWLPDNDPIAHVVGAVVGFVLLYATAEGYRRWRNREGLGLGDAKLAAAAGAWLGWQALPSMLLIACVFAFILIGVGLLARGRSALSQQIAFGLPLCLSLWLIWLYGIPNFSGAG